MAINVGLLPRPWSGHYPKVEGFEPTIHCNIARINWRRKNRWRLRVMVGDDPMYISHHDTKGQAESAAEKMLESCTRIHYYSA